MANPLVASLSALGRVALRPLGTRALRSSIALALLLGAPLACQPRATLPPPTPVYADTITVPPQDILCDSVNAPGADHKCATGADAAPSRAKSEDGSSNEPSTDANSEEEASERDGEPASSESQQGDQQGSDAAGASGSPQPAP